MSNNFVDCLSAAEELPPAEKRRMQAEFDAAFQRHLADGVDEGNAEALAAAEVLDAADVATANMVNRTNLKVLKTREMMGRIKAAVEEAQAKGRGDDSAFQVLIGILTPDHYHVWEGISLDSRVQSLQNEMHSLVPTLLEATRTKWSGLAQDEKTFEEVVKAVIDRKTPNADIQRFSGELSNVIEMLRKRFNAAGGSIRRLEDYGVYHSHSRKRISAVGEAQWIERILPLLDHARTFTKENGEPFTEQGKRALLSYIYRGVVNQSDFVKVDGRASMTSYKEMSKFHQEMRKLHFKDGDSFVSYHKEFGEGTLYESIMAGIHGRVIEVAALEHLGPDPDGLMATILNNAVDEHGMGKLQRDKILAAWYHVNGAASSPHYQILADAGRGMRSINLASNMGMAILAAITDEFTSIITAAGHNIPMWKILSGHLEELASLSPAERNIRATRLGWGADYAISLMPTTSRFGDIYGAGFLSKLAEIAIRAQGLQKWTVAIRRAYQQGMTNRYAQQAHLGFDALEDGLRRQLKAKGISSGMWDSIRQSMYLEDGRFELFDIAMISDQEARAHWMSFVFDETARAVPSPGTETARIVSGTHKTGTMAGEGRRSAGQFMTYPISVWLGHIRHNIYSAKPGHHKAAHLGGMFMGMTMLGAIALQSKEIAKGHDPADMTDPKFWLGSMLQGGSFGLIGDFMFQDVEHSNVDDALGGLLGPAVGMGFTVAHDLVLDPLRWIAQGKVDDLQWGKRMAKFAEDYTPFKTMWWMRAFVRDTVLSELRRVSGRRSHHMTGRFDNPRWIGTGRGPDFSRILG